MSILKYLLLIGLFNERAVDSQYKLKTLTSSRTVQNVKICKICACADSINCIVDIDFINVDLVNEKYFIHMMHGASGIFF